MHQVLYSCPSVVEPFSERKNSRYFSLILHFFYYLSFFLVFYQFVLFQIGVHAADLSKEATNKEVTNKDFNSEQHAATVTALIKSLPDEKIESPFSFACILLPFTPQGQGSISNVSNYGLDVFGPTPMLELSAMIHYDEGLLELGGARSGLFGALAWTMGQHTLVTPAGRAFPHSYLASTVGSAGFFWNWGPRFIAENSSLNNMSSYVILALGDVLYTLVGDSDLTRFYRQNLFVQMRLLGDYPLSQVFSSTPHDFQSYGSKELSLRLSYSFQVSLSSKDQVRMPWHLIGLGVSQRW